MDPADGVHGFILSPLLTPLQVLQATMVPHMGQACAGPGPLLQYPQPECAFLQGPHDSPSLIQLCLDITL